MIKGFKDASASIPCIQVDQNTVLPGEEKNIQEIVCTFQIAQLDIREPWKPAQFDQNP